VQQALKVQQVQLAHKVPKVIQVRKVLLDLQVHKVHRALLVPKEHKVQQELKDLQAHKVLKEQLVPKVLLELKVQQELKVI
jgi:hypothetical protein